MTSATTTTQPDSKPATGSPSRAVAYHKLFVPIDEFPSDGDLDETMPASAAQSPQLTAQAVADIIGYSVDVIRRACGAGPYFQGDLRRLYWRTRRLWHTEYDRWVDEEYARRYGKEETTLDKTL